MSESVQTCLEALAAIYPCSAPSLCKKKKSLEKVPQGLFCLIKETT